MSDDDQLPAASGDFFGINNAEAAARKHAMYQALEARARELGAYDNESGWPPSNLLTQLLLVDEMDLAGFDFGDDEAIDTAQVEEGISSGEPAMTEYEQGVFDERKRAREIVIRAASFYAEEADTAISALDASNQDAWIHAKASHDLGRLNVILSILKQIGK